MATIQSLTPPVATLLFTGATAQGQQVGYTPAAGGGDLISISGLGIIFSAKTTGTGSTITLNSTRVSSYGDDKDITLVLAATDEQQIIIKNDGRFDQPSPNTGLIAVTYSSVTGLSVRGVVIPGSLLG